MTIKRCLNCGDPFSTRVIKLKDFCSVECKYEWKNKQIKNILGIDLDVKTKQKAKTNNYRLLNSKGTKGNEIIWKF